MNCKKCGIDCTNHRWTVGGTNILCPTCYTKYETGQKKLPIDIEAYNKYSIDFFKEDTK